jgi:hypothetical protein
VLRHDLCFLLRRKEVHDEVALVLGHELCFLLRRGKVYDEVAFLLRYELCFPLLRHRREIDDSGDYGPRASAATIGSIENGERCSDSEGN